MQEAVDGGARALTGAKREDPCYLPTVLVDVRPDMKVSCSEVFGPVVTVQPYDTFTDAIAMANDSEYGLQAGVFTNDVDKVFLAHRDLARRRRDPQRRVARSGPTRCRTAA